MLHSKNYKTENVKSRLLSGKTTKLLSVKKQIRLLAALALMLFTFNSKANNIQVSNVSVIPPVISGGTTFVKFDLTWENSWKSTAIGNYDAAWVFFKVYSDGAWSHLNLTGVPTTPPTGYVYKIYSDNKGVMIYNNNVHSGTFSLPNIQIAVDASAILGTFDIKAYAIEMVYVPQGNFAFGKQFGGTGTDNHLTNNLQSGGLPQITGTIIRHVRVDASSPIDDVQLQNPGIGIRGGATTSGLDNDDDGTVDNPGFPVGWKAFYCMKYEISQGSYRDFLNSVNSFGVQYSYYSNNGLIGGFNSMNTSNAHVYATSTGAFHRNIIFVKTFSPNFITPAVFGCDGNGNGTFDEPNAGDGEYIAMNFMTGNMLSGYLTWACLRPMTELEYDKAIRPASELNAGQSLFAWGAQSPDLIAKTLNNANSANETVTPITSGAGNPNIGSSNLGGPVRNGAYATPSSGRLASNASYWGIMELTGNVAEMVLSLGESNTRLYSGFHGDGSTSFFNFSLGLSTYPPQVIFKGGSYNSVCCNPLYSESRLMPPASASDNDKTSDVGGRGVRSDF